MSTNEIESRPNEIKLPVIENKGEGHFLPSLYFKLINWGVFLVKCVAFNRQFLMQLKKNFKQKGIFYNTKYNVIKIGNETKQRINNLKNHYRK